MQYEIPTYLISSLGIYKGREPFWLNAVRNKGHVFLRFCNTLVFYFLVWNFFVQNSFFWYPFVFACSLQKLVCMRLTFSCTICGSEFTVVVVQQSYWRLCCEETTSPLRMLTLDSKLPVYERHDCFSFGCILILVTCDQSKLIKNLIRRNLKSLVLWYARQVCQQLRQSNHASQGAGRSQLIFWGQSGCNLLFQLTTKKLLTFS